MAITRINPDTPYKSGTTATVTLAGHFVQYSSYIYAVFPKPPRLAAGASVTVSIPRMVIISPKRAGVIGVSSVGLVAVYDSSMAIDITPSVTFDSREVGMVRLEGAVLTVG